MKVAKMLVVVFCFLFAGQAHADVDEFSFLGGVVDAIVDSDYDGVDLGGASSIQSGRNYSLSCIEYRAAILSNEELLNGMAVGLAYGVADALAQLHCFVRDRRCSCLRDWPVGNAAAFGRLIGAEIATCQRDRPASGALQQALMSFCH